jgi:hypothetical protein
MVCANGESGVPETEIQVPFRTYHPIDEKRTYQWHVDPFY